MVDKVVGAETGRDVDRRKEWASGSEEPLIERVDRMIERLELLEHSSSNWKHIHLFR